MCVGRRVSELVITIKLEGINKEKIEEMIIELIENKTIEIEIKEDE